MSLNYVFIFTGFTKVLSMDVLIDRFFMKVLQVRIVLCNILKNGAEIN